MQLRKKKAKEIDSKKNQEKKGSKRRLSNTLKGVAKKTVKIGVPLAVVSYALHQGYADVVLDALEPLKRVFENYFKY